jgi:hypothetical protein
MGDNSERDEELALRESYNDSCKWQQVRWSMV